MLSFQTLVLLWAGACVAEPHLSLVGQGLSDAVSSEPASFTIDDTTYVQCHTEQVGKWAKVVVGCDSRGNTAMLTKHADDETTHMVVRTPHDRGSVRRVHMQRGVMRSASVVETAGLPDEAAPIPQPEPEPARNVRRTTTCPRRNYTDSSGMVVLRVGVVITPEATSLQDYGNEAAVQSEVAAAVAEANGVALPLSGIPLRLELCFNGVVRTPQSLERGESSATLFAFSESPEVAAAATTGKCDTMVLFTTLQGGMGGRACGIGYLPGKFAAVAAQCFVDNFSFLHELGHNLGACHGPPARLCGAGANAFGDPAHGFRTILAYRSICSDKECTRIPRFSNTRPEFGWQGNVIGNRQSDNAWIINANKEGAAKAVC